MESDASRIFGQALENLHVVKDQGGLTETQQRDLEAAIEALESLGECQQDVPYSALRPVGRPDGTFKWCCNHETEHCY